MPVRNAFQRLRQQTWDRFWANARDRTASADEHAIHWQRLVDAINEFERGGLDHGYRNTVLSLRIHAASTSPDRTRAAALYTLEGNALLVLKSSRGHGQ